MKKYDFLIVGAGLFGCVCAERLINKGFSVLVIEKKNHIGGTCYTENIEGINVHKYGAHIFRTDNKAVYDYLRKFCSFNNFINSPIAVHKGKAYNSPFNMNTFTRIREITKPDEAMEFINKEIANSGIVNPKNLEEQAISLAGNTIYQMFIKEYTEKQWGKKCSELPSDIIRRIPLRFTYDNNYYNADYQGIPIGGYTQIFEKMLSGCEVLLNTDFNANKEHYIKLANKIIYTGPIDEFFDYCFGTLEYRGLVFKHKVLTMNNYQGNAVFNYSDSDIPYTRSIEHKYFENCNSNKTVVSFEYPSQWKKGDYPYYPVNDSKKNSRYSRYCELAGSTKNIFFGGRRGLYKYFDMQDTIDCALKLIERICG